MNLNSLFKDLRAEVINEQSIKLNRTDIITNEQYKVTLDIHSLTNMVVVKASLNVSDYFINNANTIVDSINANPLVGLYRLNYEASELELMTTVWIDKSPTVSKLNELTDTICTQLGTTFTLIKSKLILEKLNGGLHAKE